MTKKKRYCVTHTVKYYAEVMAESEAVAKQWIEHIKRVPYSHWNNFIKLSDEEKYDIVQDDKGRGLHQSWVNTQYSQEESLRYNQEYEKRMAELEKEEA